MEEKIKNIQEVVATLISWAAGDGLGYTTATELFAKLYSESEDRVDQ